ncbi:ribosomal protein S18-alanine N-acetyltransferase [Parazoarcus communis]|nr:ribosomal protein S18-alanine N-acetyltransferase [Parazoarcus communis]
MTVCETAVFTPMSEDDLDWVSDREAELHPFPWSRGNFADALAAGYASWIMHEAGRPIGYSIVLGVLDEAHLLNISVVRDAQGQGRGARLLAHLFAEARHSGAREFFLEVRPSNQSALALYNRSGFIEIGRRKGYYPATDGREDAIVMKASL